MNTLRCQANGCGEERQIELVCESKGGTKLIHCNTCGKDSAIFPEAKILCFACGKTGGHEPGCENDRPDTPHGYGWGV